MSDSIRIEVKRGETVLLEVENLLAYDGVFRYIVPAALTVRDGQGRRIHEINIKVDTEPDQTDLGASDDRPLGPDHIIYRGG